MAEAVSDYTAENLGTKVWFHIADYAYGESVMQRVERRMRDGHDIEVVGRSRSQLGSTNSPTCGSSSTCNTVTAGTARLSPAESGPLPASRRVGPRSPALRCMPRGHASAPADGCTGELHCLVSEPPLFLRSHLSPRCCRQSHQ